MRYRGHGVLFAVVLLCIFTLLTGCGAEEPSQDDAVGPEDCNDREFYDQKEGTCVPRRFKENGDEDAGDVEQDTGSIAEDTGVAPQEDTVDDDPIEDTGVVDTGPDCDKDNDQSLAEGPICGGNDCDDQDPFRSGEAPERCDMVDNNCDGKIDNGINCSFYAHEGEKLFKVSPFSKTATQVGSELPGLRDLDTAPDGTLYGVAGDGFYRFDESSGNWSQLREFPSDADWPPQSPNGLAIDRGGRIFITSEDVLYEMKEKHMDKSWWLMEVGKMGKTESGEKFVASGDIVINKTTMYMTSKHDDSEDYLVTLDRETGEATDKSGGVAIGHKNVFGLTSGWGKLYGLTRSGKLLTIDPRSGDSQVLKKFDREWFGAASTPNSRQTTAK